MEWERDRKKVVCCTFLCLVLGTWIGCLVFFVCTLGLELPIMEYGIEDFGVLQMKNISNRLYAIYVCKQRMVQWGAFFALGCLASYYVAAGGYNLLVGIYYGFLLTDCFVKFGVRGILFSLFCFAPHYVISFFAVYWMGKWFVAKPAFIQKSCNIYVKNMQYFVKIFLIIFLIAGSVFFEIKFQKNILNYFYQYLV